MKGSDPNNSMFEGSSEIKSFCSAWPPNVSIGAWEMDKGGNTCSNIQDKATDQSGSKSDQ